MVAALNNFNEEGGPVFNRFGEDLQKVSFVIIVTKNLVLLENVDVLGDFVGHVWEVLAKVIVVGLWNTEEIDTARS